MTHAEFTLVTDELKNFFGERHFPENKLGRIWQIVKYISKGELEAGVNSIMDVARHAPTPGEIRMACRSAIERAKAEQIRLRLEGIAGRCAFCDNKGKVFAVLKDNPSQEFQFSCTCQAARILGFKILQWDEKRHSAKYNRLSWKAPPMPQYSERPDINAMMASLSKSLIVDLSTLPGDSDA